MSTPKQLSGSFRGVPFGLFNHSLESGRRTVTHEFPGRDDPYTEDLGRKARTFSVELFVLGDDVAQKRDALRSALEEKGPGVLVHPYLGTLTVQVGNFTLSETYDAQRIASFNVGFLQPGTLLFPKAATNTSSTVSSTSSAAALQAGSNAAAIDVTTAQYAAGLNSIVSQVRDATVTMAKSVALPNSFDSPTDAIQLMTPYVSDAQALQNLIHTPDLLSYSFADVIFRISSLGMTSFSAFGAYNRLLVQAQVLFDALRFPLTAKGNVMAANASLLKAVVYTAIVSSAASCAVDADYTTYDQAIETRKALQSMFDVAMLAVDDDTLFGQLQDLRANSLPVIPDPSVSLPNVVSVRVAAPSPSLVIAYDLMEGSDDEQTVLDLNGIGNPWFVPAVSGQKVLVLR